VRASEFYRAPERTMAALLARLGELRIKPASREVADATASPGPELSARVLARAEELRRQWAAQSQARAARLLAGTAVPATKPVAKAEKPTKKPTKKPPQKPTKKPHAKPKAKATRAEKPKKKATVKPTKKLKVKAKTKASGPSKKPVKKPTKKR
jgi:hypothetical protein